MHRGPKADALVSVEGGGFWVDGLGRGEAARRTDCFARPAFHVAVAKTRTWSDSDNLNARKVVPTRSRPTMGRSKTKPANQLPMSDKMLSQEGLNQGPADGFHLVNPCPLS